MNCQIARLLLPFARPSSTDLNAAERKLVETHLAACLECAAIARDERSWDERLGPAMRNVPIPEGLKDRLLARLAADCKAAHRLRRRVFQLAAAAALFAGFAFTWYWIHHGSGLVDLSEHMSFISTTDPGLVLDQLRADGKLANLDFPEELYQWDFSLLTDYYVQLSDGQRIPTLKFRKDDTEAKVTLWRRGKIDTSRINETNTESIRLLGVDGEEEYIGKVEIRGGKHKYRAFLKPGAKTTA